MKNKILKFMKWLLGFLYVVRCPYCGKLIDKEEAGCKDCLKEVEKEKALVYINVEGFENVRVVSSFVYKDKVRKAIVDFKFGGKTQYAKQFSASLEKDFKSLIKEDFDFVTSVPLSRKRKKERGFNQAEILAKEVGNRLGLEYKEVIEKIKDNKIQHNLSREERIKNVKNVYKITDIFLVKGKKIIVCDDIMTTGSTLKECCRVILESGAKEVLCISTAFTFLGY